MEDFSTVNIKTEWDIVAARRIARQTARTLGFDTVDQARIATAISEIAKNIFLYAQYGHIRIETIEKNQEKGISITATDNGPGIKDIQNVLGKGKSISNGLGTGLPGVKRIMDSIEIESEVGKGTIIRIEKWLREG